mmetsp:Transcript_8609/g.39129  ORF Transcript_8609/g.39129 Transcript_8609/m.39129 type:complete len:159 (-) Transcript_8609:3193-3669(-)
MENTIGDAPSEWYREEEHIGYDVDGRRILKRRWNDSIENLLHTIDDPSYWRKVFDEKEDREISLSRAHLELIQRLRNGAFPNKSSNGDMRQEQNHEVAEVAWSTNHEPKRRFVPSKWRVSKFHMLGSEQVIFFSQGSKIGVACHSHTPSPRNVECTAI